ncbi:hypothetical protein ACMDCT_00875 [Halomonadaceae bacterium KBTZ08]
MMGSGNRMKEVLSTLLAFALLVTGWYCFGTFQQRQAPREPRVHLELEGSHYRVPASRLPELHARSDIWFRQGAELAQAALGRHLEERVDGLFHPVEARVPAFLDWYYSLRGEYTRLGGWALATLGLETRQRVAAKTQALLFEATNFRHRLGVLERKLAVDAGRWARRTQGGWRRMMRVALRDYEVPPPLRHRDEENERVLDQAALSQVAVAGERRRLGNRLALSSMGGVATGTLVWRAATRAAVASGGRVAAARGAGRLASRVGSAALAGAGVCSVTGPVAVGCGLVTGTVAWISIDWAMIEADEWANRGKLERRLRAGLDDVQQDLKRQLSRALVDRLVALNARQRARIHNTLTPLDTIKRAATEGGGPAEQG